MTGPNFTTVSACATGGHALGESSEIIRRGDADIMVAGGAEAGIYEPMVGGFAAMRALSTRNDDPEGASRPFDTGRDGFVIGEGVGMVILEALEHAEARGVRILAELIGYGATADASHITLPAPGGIGAVRAARRAIEKAGISAADIDHVNAHATSTPEGDKAELQAMRTIFGEDVGRVAITANKSMLGHTLGAAGAHRGHRHDPRDPRGVRAADDQPRRSRSRGRGPRPDAEHRPATGHPDRPEQLVRLRRPEHRPDLRPVGRVNDDDDDARGAVAEPEDDGTGEAAADVVLEVDGAPAPAPPLEADPPAPRDGGDVELLALIDRLAALLDRSDLSELEVESGGTGLVLRKPVAFAVAAGAGAATSGSAAAGGRRRPVPSRRAPPANRPRPGVIRRPWPARR